MLRGPWDTTTTVKIAPTADDLEHAAVGYHLDFPGDALDPGCTYERFSKRVTAGSPPTTYAHITKQAGVPNKLALQYWFFYAFNDFDNLHEGDWEMIQLNFDAATPEQALAKGPSMIGYSQHEGAEKADWGAAKLQIVNGTHPVVYPASGSHANYFDSAIWLGRTAQQGVGCDDTEAPHHEITPTVAYVPGRRRSTCRSTHGSATWGRGARSSRGCSTAPPGPTRSPSGPTRSRGRITGGRRA